MNTSDESFETGEPQKMDILEIRVKIFDLFYNQRNNAEVKKFFLEYEQQVMYMIGEDDPQLALHANLIVAVYLEVTTNDKSYKHSLPYLDKVIAVIENLHIEYPDRQQHIFLMKRMRYLRGVANFNIGRYKLSQIDFDWLIERYPEDYDVQGWIIHLKNVRLRKIETIAIYCIYAGTVLMLLRSILSETTDITFSAFERLPGIILSMLGILTYLTCNMIRRWRYKKARRKS
jgi:hypothetical protein